MTDYGGPCPQCGQLLEVSWEWCRRCGFDPAGRAAEHPLAERGAELATGSASPSPSLSAPTPRAPEPAPGGRPDNTRIATIVAGAVVVLILVTLFVWHDRSTSGSSARASSTPPPTEESTTTVDPTPALARQYITIAAKVEPPLQAYETAWNTVPFSIDAPMAAVPALTAAEHTESTELDALADGAPGVLASHLVSLSHLAADAARKGDQLVLLGTRRPASQVERDLEDFETALARAQEVDSLVRLDLGITRAQPMTPATPQTI